MRVTKETITGEELMNFVRRPSEESAETAEAAVPAQVSTGCSVDPQQHVSKFPFPFLYSFYFSKAEIVLKTPF